MAGMPGAAPLDDAVPTRLREGLVLDYRDVLQLRALLPVEVWRNRDAFFFAGMQMQIGPCHRVYPFPAFWDEATAAHAGKATVDSKGNLRGYVAGTPFPQDSVPADAKDAAVMWAWNLEQRYRGAGISSSFRILDMPSLVGKPETYKGHFFYVKTHHRADLPHNDYAMSGDHDAMWIFGGKFDKPFNARHLAWRQFRPPEALTKYSRSDDTFVYVPTMRRVRRAATSWTDGAFTPSYRVGGELAGGGLATGSNEFTPTGSISPTAARSAANTEHIQRGFFDLSFRPNAYVWRVVDQREVLAPINITRSGYPESMTRNFGPSGLSIGDDRWEVRWAVVIEGLSRQRGRDFARLILWIDYQTLRPLYIITRSKDGRLLDDAIPAHRFSGDVFDYPTWSDGSRALVFDPVAAVFYNETEGGTGWRRESYDAVSIPPDQATLRRYLSPDFLERGN